MHSSSLQDSQASGRRRMEDSALLILSLYLEKIIHLSVGCKLEFHFSLSITSSM